MSVHKTIMKYDITAVIVKNKATQEILDIQSVDDCYCEVFVEYPPELLTKEDLLKYFRSYERAGKYLDQHDKNLCITLQAEAKDLPNLGDVIVEIQTRSITQQEFLKLPLSEG